MSRTPAKVFFGWRVVAAVFVLAAFGWGLGFYGPPVYLYAVRDARGWSVPLVSMAVTTHFLFGAVVVACLPRLYLRFGVPAVTKTGVVVLAFGVLGWALAEEPWQLFLATMLSGGGWVTMGAAAVNAIVAPWFVRLRPAALASAYNGASIGGAVFSPLLVAAIGALGFPLAALVIVSVMVAVVWLLTDRYVATSPEQMGLAADGDPADPMRSATVLPSHSALAGRLLWRDLRFLTLAAGMALGLFAQIGVLAHLVSLLVPVLGAQGAGFAAGGATAAAIAGRTLVGWLMPAGADRRSVAAMSYIVQIFGVLALLASAGHDVPLILMGVGLFGAGIGNATSLPPMIAQVEFVKEDVARVVPLIVAIGQATYAFAPAVFGVLRTITPTAPPAFAPWLFIAAAVIQGLAIIMLLIGRRRQ
jgi:Major Facilitator Superfamily